MDRETGAPAASNGQVKPDLNAHQPARNYPYNCWWVAATSEEVGRDLLSRWILDMPILLYRQEDGTAVAMEDRCPHRSAPLSMGKLQGDNVVCGYHGFEFAPDGKCVRVPTQANPGRIRSRAYPVLEQYPFVWIYTGDVDRIYEVPKPLEAMKWACEPDMFVVHGYIECDANYMILQENVLDLTHVPYVHMKTISTVKVDPPVVKVEGDVVISTLPLLRGPLIPLYDMGSGIEPGVEMDQVVYSTFQSPAFHKSGTNITDTNAAPGERQHYKLHFAHIATPIDMRSMHYWWAAGRDYGETAPDFKSSYAALPAAAFAEDKVILEAMQRVKDRVGDENKLAEFSVGADAGPVEARRSLQRWMARES